MKLRIIDSKLVPAIRRPVDRTWQAFANHLITAFGDITQQNGSSKDDVELIYCHHRMREIDEQLLDSLVYNVPPAFIPTADLMTASTDEGYESASAFFDQRLQWKSSKDSPFLLLGYVGTGKTTFLDFYFYHHITTINPKVCAAIVNFKTAPDSDSEFLFSMLDQVEQCLADIDPVTAGENRATLKLLYAREVTAIQNSIETPALQTLEIDRLFALVLRSRQEKDVKTYSDFIGKKIKHLRDNGKQLWIVLDNIDQHFHCLHHRAFVNAVAIANSWQCPLVISMRYVTLHTPGARQTYDSFRPRRLKLSLPHIERLLHKRMQYFKLLADPLLAAQLPWTGHTLNVKDLSNEIQKCVSLLGKPPFLSTTLLPLANYNLRRLLDMLLSCFQSYYFFYDRFNNERYIPNERTLFKRFLFSHLLKNNEFFDPSSRTDQDQFVVNLFENENPSAAYNQFIRIRLLQVLMHFGRHITLARFDAYVQAVFLFERHDVLMALRAFLERELIAVKNVLSPTFDASLVFEGLQEKHLARDDIEIALTYAGRLHYDLIFTLEYFEIMKFSTYVDGPVYHDIQDHTHQNTFESRAKSTRKFLEYLTRQEDISLTSGLRDKTRFDQQIRKVMPEIVVRISKQLDEVADLPEHRSKKDASSG